MSKEHIIKSQINFISRSLKQAINFSIIFLGSIFPARSASTACQRYSDIGMNKRIKFLENPIPQDRFQYVITHIVFYETITMSDKKLFSIQSLFYTILMEFGANFTYKEIPVKEIMITDKIMNLNTGHC